MHSTGEIELRSDNAAGVAPEVMAAVAAANVGSALAYGGDRWTAALTERVREVFEHPHAQVFPVSTGTAANALSLSALCPPWGAVLCHDTAHILSNEGGATSLFSGGAVMSGVAGDDFKIAPAALSAALAEIRWGDPHHSQPAVLSLTQPTDYGTLYRAEEIAALVEIGAPRHLRTHLDGARLANALVALDASPADLTWRAGVDVVSFGGTKNGLLSTDAIVSFDADASAQLVYRLKRAGHVASKLRFQSAQLLAYLTDGLWLGLARRANEAMAELAAGLDRLGVGLAARPAVNIAFAALPDDVADRLEKAGVLFYRMGPGVVRFVTSFETTPAEVAEVLVRLADALG